MKRLPSGLIAALAIWAISAQAAANPGETQAGDSVLKLDTGENTESNHNKVTYLQRVDGSIKRFGREIVLLKEQRDRLRPGSSDYKSVDLRLEAMNSRMAQVRRDLANIQSEETEKWRVVKDSIDQNLADMNRLSRGMAE